MKEFTNNYNNDDFIYELSQRFAYYTALSLLKDNLISDINDIKNDLEIDFYICGKQCEQKYQAGSGASFSTYLHSAFFNLRKTIYKEYHKKNRYEQSNVIDDEGNMIDDVCFDEYGYEEQSEIKAILECFSGLELLIVKEIICPSQKVQDAVIAYTSKFKNHKYNDDMILEYIKVAYKIPTYKFNKAIENIRKVCKSNIFNNFHD